MVRVSARLAYSNRGVLLPDDFVQSMACLGNTCLNTERRHLTNEHGMMRLKSSSHALGLGPFLSSPMCVIELLRLSFRYRQRLPLVTCVDSCQLNDLADVVTGVAQ